MSDIETGKKIGIKISTSYLKRSKPYIVCNAEDADYFASGVLEGIESCGIKICGFACYWNDVGSIINKYVEPSYDKLALVIPQYRIENDANILRNLTDLKNTLAAKISKVIVVATIFQDLPRKSLQLDLKQLFNCEIIFIYMQDNSPEIRSNAFPEIVSNRREYLKLLDTIESLTRSLDFNFIKLGDDKDIARKLFSSFSRKFVGRRIPVLKINEYMKEAHKHINGCISLIRKHFHNFENVNKDENMAVVIQYLLTYSIQKGL